MELQTKYIKLLEEKVERLEKELEDINNSEQYSFHLQNKGYFVPSGVTVATTGYIQGMQDSYPNVNPHWKK
jgi:hypothetical protein